MLWTLPKTAVFGGVEYKLNTDYRDVFEIIDVLTDEQSPVYIRWEIAISLFYEEEIPDEYKDEAAKFLSEFISYGEQERNKPQRKTIDWEQDAHMIIGDINKVAGFDVRGVPYVHWWTFLAYFNGIGEGQLSTVVNIRSKMAKGKKLEKWEQEFYAENRDLVDFRAKKADEKTMEYFDKWL